jgi:hypothetical protein
MLQLLEQQSHAFNLQPGILWLITGILALAGLCLNRLNEDRARRDALRAADRALDEVVACWPPRSANELSAFDVGARPDRAAGDAKPEERYVPRDCDGDLDRALGSEAIVVIFGPNASGKSRTAFEAVRRTRGTAPLLVPASAAGLRTLVGQAEALWLDRMGAVLWLDDLDRYAKGIDVDPLLELVVPFPDSGWYEAVRTRLPRWLGGRPARAPMQIVATVNDDKLRAVFKDTGDEAHTIQRLLAHSRGIGLDGSLSPTEQSAFASVFGQAPSSIVVNEVFPGTWERDWRPRVPTPPGRGRLGREIDMWVAILVSLLGAACGALLIVGHVYGWQQAPSLEAQVRALAEGIRPCEAISAYPPRGKDLPSRSEDENGSVLVAIIRRGDCPASDAVRFYQMRHSRLRELSAMVPGPSEPRQIFSCIGRGTDPCHVKIAGHTSFIAGAFTNADTNQALPVVISFGRGGLSLRPLSPPDRPPRDLSAALRQVDARAIRLRLVVGARAAHRGHGGPRCQPAEGCLRGRPAQRFFLLGKLEDRHPAALLAGYAAKGPVDAPDTLRVKAWRVTVDRVGLPVVERRRDCLVFRGGRVRKYEPNAHLNPIKFVKAWLPQHAQMVC